MTTPFIAEIKMFGGNFAPRGFMFCDGSLLAISPNTALFSLIGTFYGGNGSSNFALPNFRGRMPVMQGQGTGLSNYQIGQQSGTTTVTLATTEMPVHNHQISGAVAVSSNPSGAPSANAFFTNAAPNQLYTTDTSRLITMAPQSISFTGGGQPHNNQQPFLAVSFIIATSGIYPTRN